MQGLQGLSSKPSSKSLGTVPQPFGSFFSRIQISVHSFAQCGQVKKGLSCSGKASTLKTPGFLKKAPVEWV